MQKDTRDMMLHWGNLIIERITKITHNRITKITISGLFCLACSMFFGLPLIKLHYEPSLNFWELVLNFNQENPWAYVLALICVVAAVIVFIVNRIAGREVSETPGNNESSVSIKGDGNIVISNSPNSKVIK